MSLSRKRWYRHRLAQLRQTNEQLLKPWRESGSQNGLPTKTRMRQYSSGGRSAAVANEGHRISCSSKQASVPEGGGTVSDFFEFSETKQSLRVTEADRYFAGPSGAVEGDLRCESVENCMSKALNVLQNPYENVAHNGVRLLWPMVYGGGSCRGNGDVEEFWSLRGKKKRRKVRRRRRGECTEATLKGRWW